MSEQVRPGVIVIKASEIRRHRRLWADVRDELKKRDLLPAWEKIAKKYHALPEELWTLSPHKGGHASMARYELWTYLFRDAHWTFSAIARFWDVDHTTVLAGVEKYTTEGGV